MKYQVWDLEAIGLASEFDNLEAAKEGANYYADRCQRVAGVLVEANDHLDWNPAHIARPIFEVKGHRLVFIGQRARNINEAWEITMRKWHFLKNRPDVTHGGAMLTCGLCMIFSRGMCIDCPIKKVAGHFCVNTPYEAYCDAIDRHNPDDVIAAANDMFEFLKELRKNSK